MYRYISYIPCCLPVVYEYECATTTSFCQCCVHLLITSCIDVFLLSLSLSLSSSLSFSITHLQDLFVSSSFSCFYHAYLLGTKQPLCCMFCCRKYNSFNSFCQDGEAWTLESKAKSRRWCDNQVLWESGLGPGAAPWFLVLFLGDAISCLGGCHD